MRSKWKSFSLRFFLTLPALCILGIYVKIIFIFILLCGASKGFMEDLKAFMKPFGAPQGSIKIKIWVMFLSSSGIGAEELRFSW